MHARTLPAWAIILLQAAGLLVVCYLAACYMLNHFYVMGASRDAIMFSACVWHNGWFMNFPEAYYSSRFSFFRMHMTWFFWIPAFISHYLPLTRIEFFAGFVGFTHALLAFAITCCLHLLFPARHAPAVVAKILAGMLVAFNPAAQLILTQGHYEIMLPALILLFLAVLVADQRRAALICFFLALSVREDAGFHIALLMGLVLLVDRLRRIDRPDKHRWMIYALGGVAYSISMLLLKHYWSLGDDGLLKREYIGIPPFEHLSWELLGMRLEHLFLHRSFLWLPGIVAFAWAGMARNPYIALGFISTLPWLVISFFAKLDLAAQFDIHYGFPFLLAIGWPFIAASATFRQGRGVMEFDAKKALCFVALVLAVQQPFYTKSGHLHVLYNWMKFKLDPAVANHAQYEALERQLTRYVPQLGALRVDTGINGIAPYALPRGRYGLRTHFYIRDRQEWLPKGRVEQGVNAVMYYRKSPTISDIDKLIAANHLRYRYEIPGTAVLLATDFDLRKAPAFNALFAPLPARQ